MRAQGILLFKERPKLRVYIAFVTVVFVTLVFTYLDFEFTLVPRFTVHINDVKEDQFIHKFDDVFNSSSRETKQVLLWTGYFANAGIWVNEMNSYFKDCPYKCNAFSNHANLAFSDAVVFHDADIDTSDLPSMRIRRQPWILFTMEPTALVKKNYKWLDNFFNWTISYRNYSTFLHAYGQHEKLDTQASSYQLPSLTNRNKTAYASISNCHDAGRRFKIIQELQKYMEIDVYGRCGPYTCATFNGPCLPPEVLKTYKFRFSFENSHCRHYVTEKYWESLQYSVDILPIVNWVKGQVSPTVIPNSYINFYDFNSTEAFADYIEKVGSNETLYQQYFEWRKKYRFVRSDSFCKLCEKLHKPYQAQTYTDMMGWFVKDTCTKYSLTGMVGRFLERKVFDIFNK